MELEVSFSLSFPLVLFSYRVQYIELGVSMSSRRWEEIDDDDDDDLWCVSS